MSSAASHPHLRLVDAPTASEARSNWSDEQQARLAIIKENRIAAHAPGLDAGFNQGIDARDPRWMLAMQTQARLQGAILTPDRRDELMKNGKKMGLRPFETNLVIAIVQDRARSGVSAIDAKPLLSLVHPPLSDQPAKTVIWPKILLVSATAATCAMLLIRWLGT